MRSSNSERNPSDPQHQPRRKRSQSAFFRATTKQVPAEAMTPIEPGRVGAKKPVHARFEVGARGLKHEVELIGHETVSVHLFTP